MTVRPNLEKFEMERIPFPRPWPIPDPAPWWRHIKFDDRFAERITVIEVEYSIKVIEAQLEVANKIREMLK